MIGAQASDSIFIKMDSLYIILLCADIFLKQILKCLLTFRAWPESHIAIRYHNFTFTELRIKNGTHKQILVKYNSYTISLVTRDGAVLSQLSITLDAL